MKLIEFVSILEFSSNKPLEPTPEPMIKHLPEWYKKAKKYFSEKNSTYKNCAPFFDSMSAGYALLTPCDISFFIEDGEPKVFLPKGYEGFVTERPPMGEFHSPTGHYKKHFAWSPSWGVRTPTGYSALYLTPLNMFSLPFTNTSGIIDSDKVYHPGNIPFFLKEGFTGVIPKGTPYIQVIPIKRDSWESNNVTVSVSDIEHFKPGSDRIPEYYKTKVWERKFYE